MMNKNRSASGLTDFLSSRGKEKDGLAGRELTSKLSLSDLTRRYQYTVINAAKNGYRFAACLRALF
jgi:hypothetical protein